MKRLHPTILVGYGDYGRTVLERLLRSAAARGTLESSPTLGAAATWTPVGTDNPATIPVGTANAYYRVNTE